MVHLQVVWASVSCMQVWGHPEQESWQGLGLTLKLHLHVWGSVSMKYAPPPRLREEQLRDGIP